MVTLPHAGMQTGMLLRLFILTTEPVGPGMQWMYRLLLPAALPARLVSFAADEQKSGGSFTSALGTL